MLNKHISTQLPAKWQEMYKFLKENESETYSSDGYSYKKIVLFRLLTENILVFLIQYIGLMISSLTSYPALVWFASGTSIAFIFLRGMKILPGIWLGSFLAYFSSSLLLKTSIYYATIFFIQAYLFLKISYLFSLPTLVFHRIFPFLKFVFIASIITGAIAFALTFSLTSQYFLYRWLANLNGVLIFGFTIINWDAYFPELKTAFQQRRWLVMGRIGLMTVFFIFALFFNVGAYLELISITSINSTVILLQFFLALTFIAGFVMILKIATPCKEHRGRNDKELIT